jgi:hypothetical protein
LSRSSAIAALITKASSDAFPTNCCFAN